MTFPYQPILYHLDLSILAYQLYAQTVAWPFDPYYELFGDRDVRRMFMRDVRDWVKKYQCGVASRGIDDFHGPSVIEEPGKYTLDPLDAFLYKYDQMDVAAPAFIRPEHDWNEYATPEELTGQVARLGLSYLPEKDSPVIHPKVVFLKEYPYRVRRKDGCDGTVIAFEGQTGGLTAKTPKSWSILGYVYRVQDRLHIVFRGSCHSRMDNLLSEGSLAKPSSPDWVMDSARAVIENKTISRVGAVKAGYAAALCSAIPAIKAALLSIERSHRDPPERIYVNGHGLGGALAAQFASTMLLGRGRQTYFYDDTVGIRDWPWDELSLIMFSAPVAGNRIWAEALNDKLCITSEFVGAFANGLNESLKPERLLFFEGQRFDGINLLSEHGDRGYRIQLKHDPIAARQGAVGGQQIGVPIVTDHSELSIALGFAAHDPDQIRKHIQYWIHDECEGFVEFDKEFQNIILSYDDKELIRRLSFEKVALEHFRECAREYLRVLLAFFRDHGEQIDDDVELTSLKTLARSIIVFSSSQMIYRTKYDRELTRSVTFDDVKNVLTQFRFDIVNTPLLASEGSFRNSPLVPDSREFHSVLLQIINAYLTNGTHTYYWPSSGSWAGVTQNLEYDGEVLYKGDTEKRCYCSGITFEVFFLAYKQWCENKGKAFKINGLDSAGVKKLKTAWFGDPVKNRRCAVGAIEEFKVGYEVEAFEDARKGDFVQLWRHAKEGHTESGHAVVFMEWVRNEDGGIKGVTYWSSQKSTDGISLKTEYFGTTPWKLKRDEFFIGRVGHLDDGVDSPVVVETVTPSAAQTDATTTLLKRGAKGEDVKELQTLLNDNGYSLGVDGDFGGGTERLVKRFQTRNNLEADGIVGKATWAALRSPDVVRGPGVGGTPTQSSDDDEESGGSSTAKPLPSSAHEVIKPDGAGDLVTLGQLKKMLPKASSSNRHKFHRPLNKTMIKYQINTPIRICHFLAQVAHESGNLQFDEEIWSNPNLDSRGVARNGNKWQLKYEGRSDLGNTQTGDGYKFRGRGLIQLTGRANYTKYGKAISQDLTNGDNPDKVAKPTLAADAAGWYWDGRSLNKYADQDNLIVITRKINGGYNGFEDRNKHLNDVKKVFGLPEVTFKIPPKTVLKQGSSGDLVKEAQRLLIQLGYKELEVNSEFDAKMKAVVIKFQKSQGLGADGVIGQGTWGTLYSVTSSSSSGGGGSSSSDDSGGDDDKKGSPSLKDVEPTQENLKKIYDKLSYDMRKLGAEMRRYAPHNPALVAGMLEYVPYSEQDNLAYNIVSNLKAFKGYTTQLLQRLRAELLEGWTSDAEYKQIDRIDAELKARKSRPKPKPSGGSSTPGTSEHRVEKEPYANQRDNVFSGSDVYGDESKYKSKVSGSNMCNVTTLAMMLRTLKPRAHIKKVLLDQLKKGGRDATWISKVKDYDIEDLIMFRFKQLGAEYWEPGIRKYLGNSKFSFKTAGSPPHQYAYCLMEMGKLVIKGAESVSIKWFSHEKSATEIKDYFIKTVKPKLTSGVKIMVSTRLTKYGHIVYLKEIRSDGIIINDPYGINLGTAGSYLMNGKTVAAQTIKDKLTAIQGRLKYHSDMNKKMVALKDKGGTIPETAGETNFYKWSDVKSLRIGVGKWMMGLKLSS